MFNQGATMSLFNSPRFLPTVLWADAASGAGTAALQLLAAGMLAPLLGIPAWLLTASGVALLVYMALAAWLANAQPVPRGQLMLLIAGNWLWVAGCLVLLFAGSGVTALGQGYLVMQAVAVAVLAELQWMGLRRNPVRGWA
jgi:hypothetical protein